MLMLERQQTCGSISIGDIVKTRFEELELECDTLLPGDLIARRCRPRDGTGGTAARSSEGIPQPNLRAVEAMGRSDPVLDLW